MTLLSTTEKKAQHCALNTEPLKARNQKCCLHFQMERTGESSTLQTKGTAAPWLCQQPALSLLTPCTRSRASYPHTSGAPQHPGQL